MSNCLVSSFKWIEITKPREILWLSLRAMRSAGKIRVFFLSRHLHILQQTKHTVQPFSCLFSCCSTIIYRAPLAASASTLIIRCIGGIWAVNEKQWRRSWMAKISTHQTPCRSKNCAHINYPVITHKSAAVICWLWVVTINIQ